MVTQVVAVALALAAAGQSSEIPIDADSWSSHVPDVAGVDVRYTHETASRSGKKCLVIDVGVDSPVTFYQYFQDIDGLRSGELWELSAWIRTEDAAGGVGAYLSIGALNEKSERFVAADSERVTGTTDWTRVSCVLFVPEQARGHRLLLLHHGTGRAWFDDVKLKRLGTLQAASDRTVEIQVSDEPIMDQFIGFGIEDDLFFFTEENYRHGIDEADVALRNDRLQQLDPSVIATLFWWDAICPTRDLSAITYDTEMMRALYRILDVHQKAGREILFSDAHWGWAPEQFPYSEANVERGAAAYAALFRHLVVEKGYTCIRYVSVSGEVDLVFEKLGGTFESYIEAGRLLRAGLDEAGLHDVAIISDKTAGLVWFGRAIERADESYGLYAVHEYPDVTQYPVINHRLRSAMDVIRGAGGAETPAFVWEIGFRDQSAHDTDNSASAVHKYSYGLLCANTAIAAMNEGYAGGSVWCLHSMFYPGQNRMDFGLWEFKDKGWRIRPIYYAYGLFTRFARAGLRPVKVDVSPQAYDFSTAALLDETGAYRLFAVNLSDKPLEAAINGLSERAYEVYEYAEERIPSPSDAGYGKVSALLAEDSWSRGDGPIVIRPRTVVLVR